MPVNLNRRSFVRSTAALFAAGNLAPLFPAPETRTNDRSVGLLIGSLLGDAMGGPLEFANGDIRNGHVVAARQWNDSKLLDSDAIAAISKDATLMSYEKVRPETAAYGPWVAKAPAGTVTDDSRWKIILVRAVAAAQAESKEVTQKHIAKAICDFCPKIDQPTDTATKKLVDEGLREYRYAANWVLGERDSMKAFPLDRLWAGIPNCSGQMMLLPLAIQYAGDPETAYRKSFELNFIDAAGAKDIASMIVAALASVLGTDADALTIELRWEKIHHTMKNLDPMRLKNVPFAGRPLDKWLELVDSIVQRANGRPAVAYRLLETEGKPVYYWDAHFTMVVAFTLLRLCKYDPMCSLAMAIDFGHDTDSYAQLIGAFAGAVCGQQAFPVQMLTKVGQRLKEDYDEDVNEWVNRLQSNKETIAE